MQAPDTRDPSWQAQADLLADGREWLERQCRHWRLRHLFPDGPDLALLLRAFQDLDRLEQTRPERFPHPRRRRRALRRLISARVRAEALDRDRRLHWHYPLPRTERLGPAPPPVVEAAFEAVDADARSEVRRIVTGGGTEAQRSQSGSMARISRVEARLDRGLRQFATALFNGALASPASIRSLHPQYISFLESSQPTRTAHPVATLLFIKLPLQLMAGLSLLFLLAYVGAWAYLNHPKLDNGKLLAGILTERLDAFLTGDLEFERVYFELDLLPSLFIPGRKAHLTAFDVNVYAPAEPLGLEARRHIAHADEIALELDLAEVIPWNRIGVPRALEIPWLLHFGRVESRGGLWLEVHQYLVEGAEEPVVGLVEAFKPAGELNQPDGLRTIGIRLDQLVAEDVRFELDFDAASRWRTELFFDSLEAELDFEGHFPELPLPPEIPLRWSAKGSGGRGSVDAVGQHIELEDMELEHAGSGRAQTPAGDLRITGQAVAHGSPLRFDGFLRRLLHRETNISLAYKIVTPDAGGIVRRFVPPPDDDRPAAVVADGVRATVSASGPIDDPTIRLVAQGMQLNLLPERAWAIDDVDLSLTLVRDVVAERWHGDLFPDGRPEGEVAEGEGSPERDADQRWQVVLETVRGAALDGDLRLGTSVGDNHIVLPGTPGEPLLVSLGMELRGVNPGQLLPHDPEQSRMLAGAASGTLELGKIILDDAGRGGLRRIEARIFDLRLRRDRGPEADRLPRSLRGDGEVFYDAEAGLDLRGLRISTDGGTINASGGIDTSWSSIRRGYLGVAVQDGRAFLAAFGLDHYFDRLDAELDFSGPVGAPSGSQGPLALTGLRLGDLLLADDTQARIWIERGVLRVRAPDARLLGGHGPLELDVVLFEGGRLASDPKIRVVADLDGMDRDLVFGVPVAARGASVSLFIDDGAGGPVRLSQLSARGAAYAERLQVGTSSFRDASTQFAFTEGGLRIDSLELDYHRPLSPLHNPDATVIGGRVSARGSVQFGAEPALDLDLRASGLPISTLLALAGTDAPIRGEIATGTELHVAGTPSRPEISGVIALDALSAADLPLGAGRLELATVERPSAEGRDGPPHQEIQVEGQLRGVGRQGEEGLDWSLSAQLTLPAEGPKRERRAPELHAVADVRALPLSSLLAHPDRAPLDRALMGQLNGLRIEATHCSNRDPVTAACAGVDVDRGPLQVGMSLQRLWVARRHEPGDPVHPLVKATGDPCSDPVSLCSAGPLEAHLEREMLTLTQPWELRTGGPQGSTLALAGSFDLAAPPPDAGAPERCEAGAPSLREVPGRGGARLEGKLDLRALAPVVEALGIESPEGAVSLAVAIDGLVARPTLAGTVELPSGADPLRLRWRDESDDEAEARGRRKAHVIPLALESLWLELDAGRVFADASVRVFDELLRVRGRPQRPEGQRSFYTIAGACQGQYRVTADGSIDGKLVAALAPDLVSSSSGRVALPRFEIEGALGTGATPAVEPGPVGGTAPSAPPPPPGGEDPPPLVSRIEAELRLGRDAALGLRTSTERLTLQSGRIELLRCGPGDPCPEALIEARSVAIFLGGRLGATANARPRDAVALSVGEFGAADAWGWVGLTPDFSALQEASLNARLDRVPYTQLDNSGSPELELTLSSPRVTIRADEFGGLSVGGKVLVEKSRWLRNANVGTSVLSFSDPVPAPPAQLPQRIRDLSLALDVRTTAPFRADINVLQGLEASAEFNVEGTVGNPEVKGVVTLERGLIDIPIIGEPYEISRGRLVIDRDIRNSRVDIAAVGLEPKLIDNQLKTVTLNVQGPLDAVTWSCSTLGDVSGALSTTRGCTEYILFGAGSAEIAQTDVSRAGGGGNLVGRPLTLVGNLTEVTLNDYLEDEAPRLERFTPEVSARVEQLGFAVKLETKPEWFDFGPGQLNFGVNYLRGYPGGLLRDSTRFYGRFDILDQTALEFSAGRRNFTQRQLVLDPPVYSGIEFVQSHRIPSRR